MTAHPPRRRRGETGATTAEYVGIVALVALIAAAMFVIVKPTRDAGAEVMRTAYCRIGAPFGFVSCTNAELPGYIPTNCTVRSHEGSAGGSVTIIAEAKGDSGYTLSRVRQRQDDGSIKDTYVVKTKGSVGGGYEFNLGGGAEADTGSGSVNAKGSAKAKIEGDVTWGKSFTFDTQDAAQAFIDQYKDNFGAFGSDPEGAPKPDSTYHEIGAKGTLSGEVGPASGNVSGQAVLGLEEAKNGDKTVKLALTVSAAAKLGIPLPSQLLKVTAEGSVSAVVIANATFDKDGNLAALGGTVQYTPTAAAGVEINTDLAKPSTGKHAKPQTLQSLTLPPLARLDYGKNYSLSFSTTFRRSDGSYDYSGVTGVSDAVRAWVNGEPVPQSARDAIADQLNNHSQITFNTYDYHKDEEKYGGSVHVLWVNVGAEVHMVTIDQNLTSGYYYDPVQGLWAQNIVCGT